jgi:hypothetical protein
MGYQGLWATDDEKVANDKRYGGQNDPYNENAFSTEQQKAGYAKMAGEAAGMGSDFMSQTRQQRQMGGADSAGKSLSGESQGQGSALGSSVGNLGGTAASATPWGAIAGVGLAYTGEMDRISRKKHIKLSDMTRLAYPTQSGMFGKSAANNSMFGGGKMGGMR